MCLDIRELGKSFSGVRALDRVTFSVAPGQVHGVLGANGAGKSTLMKILNGVYPFGTYEGEIYLRGDQVRFHSPHDALSAGLGYVPQELNVIEQLTVAENVFVGRLAGPGHVALSLRDVRRRAVELFDRWGIGLAATQLVARLRASERQLVMISRALAVEPSVLVLDEPTSSLTSDETERLFGIVRTLTGAGVTVILITHRMREILDVCQAVTVLRDGTAVSTYQRAEFDEDRMVQDMVGQRVENIFPERQNASLGTEALRVDHLFVHHPFVRHKYIVDDVSFSVHHGEVLGIAGMMGAGRTELLNALYGRLPHEGEVFVDERPVRIRTPREAKEAGLALLTEDRKGEGILFNLDIGRNVSVGSLAGISKSGLVNKTLERAKVGRLVERLKIKAPSVRTMVDKLSGGNQQKVVLARVLISDPKVILLDEATKGVDVLTKQEIYRLILSLADGGAAVLFVSSEFPELLGICDRIIVLADGHLVEDVRASATTEAQLVAAAGRDE